jgi:hypothetical protein
MHIAQLDAAKDASCVGSRREFSLFLRQFVLFFRVLPCYNPFEI